MRKQLVEQFLAFLILILLIVLSFLTLVVFRRIFNLQQDAITIAILLAPPLIYLILAGKLLEFNIGGVGAKFNATVNAPAFKESRLEAREIEIAEKLNYSELSRFLRSISNSMFITLIARLGRGARFYNADALRSYLRELSHLQGYIFLVLLDQDGRVFAYLTSWQAMRIIEREKEGDPDFQENGTNRFVQAINLGRKDVLLREYELITTTLTATDTNIFALEKMTELNVDALLVTDKDDKLKGVVERVQVQSKLLLSLPK